MGDPERVSAAEIAALTARLRSLTQAGRAADGDERERFIADKQRLLARIEAQTGERIEEASGPADMGSDRGGDELAADRDAYFGPCCGHGRAHRGEADADADAGGGDDGWGAS